MHLKRVSMSGFKSFADKVDFDFGPGVTCIVGPNGCGKSNVIDAFKWVLGEQSAKSLRGRQMQDMIFNGSSARKASSMAQVDMVFDNADRTLPVDRDEVTITRKLYRSGESEYLVCKEPARLKDIRDLFMDTGIGSNAYAVIEQGKVAVLLHSSPNERRLIFEEAAGISRYKARRKEAQRKLERTEQNLLRVVDIIEEVEKRLRSVKLQAGKARNFQQYDARLRELRASFSMAEYHRLTKKIESLKEELSNRGEDAGAAKKQINDTEAAISAAQQELDKLAEEIGLNDNKIVGVRSDITALEERTEAARLRIEEQKANLRRAEGRHEQEQRRFQQLDGELKTVEEQAESLQEQTQAQNESIEKLNHEEQEMARKVTQTRAVLEDEKAGVVDLLRRTTQLHNEIISLAKHADSLSDQKGKLSLRDAAIHEELQGHIERRSSLEEKLREVEQLIEQETERLEERKAAARRTDENRARLVEELAEAKERRSGLNSRIQVLQDLQKKMEGIGAGVRQVLDRKHQHPDRPSSQAVLGILADFFETEVYRAPVIEAALGERARRLVATDSEIVLADVELFAGIKEQAAVYCLNRLPETGGFRDFADQPGFVSTALDFVRYPEHIAPLAKSLLGRSIIVDRLDNALAMSAEDDAGYRFVTLRGEVVEADGCVRIGPPRAGSGLISRRTELRALGQEQKELEQLIENLTAELNRTSAEASHLEKVQQELRTAIYEMHTAKVETNAAVSNAAEAIRRLTSEQPLIAGEVAAIEKQISEAHDRKSQDQQSLVELEETSKQREERVTAMQRQLDELAAQRQQVGERLTQARVIAGQLAEKRAAAAETINALRRGIREAQEGVEAAVQEIDDCHARIKESEETIAGSAERLEELAAKVEELEARGLELRKERDELRLRIEGLATTIKEVRAQLEEIEHLLHELDMAHREAGIRRDELTTRVQEELELDLAALYEEYDHSEQDWEAVEQEIAELKKKIDRLGNINLDAIQEQDELEERFTFLSNQKTDLEESRKQLDSLIADLNKESEERFNTAFYAIRDNFRDLFRKLFGGGKADIILENPEDVLESGIEVLARPPGKETQSITLLSGGEKSMAAIALLMAIFRSRPSPCALMDEVDAALDEANNERFNGIIQEFLDRSQFIVISHSKRTMTIADQMYGITMQEPGVSTRVSVKFDREGDPESAVA